MLIFLLPRTISRAAARSPPRLLSCASSLYSTFDPALLQQRVCMSAQLRSEPTRPTQHSKTCHHHQDCGFFSSLGEGERGDTCTTKARCKCFLLRVETVFRLRRDMNWTIAFSAFEEMLEGLPCRVYRSAGGIGAKFLFVLTKQFCWGRSPGWYRSVPHCVHPKNGDTNAQGLLIRTPEALRLLTLCNFDGKIIFSLLCAAFGSTPLSASIRLKGV